jgi:hypothetical protein
VKIWKDSVSEGCEEILPKGGNLFANILIKVLGRDSVHTIMCISGLDLIPSAVGLLPLMPAVLRKDLSTDFSGMDNDRVIQLLIHEVQKRSSNNTTSVEQTNEMSKLHEEIKLLKKQNDHDSAHVKELKGLLNEKDSRINMYVE